MYKTSRNFIDMVHEQDVTQAVTDVSKQWLKHQQLLGDDGKF
jgi:hypothetical protein